MSDRSARLARSAAMASITVALVLVALKSWASWRTGSTAMLGSLADSALDLIASLATLIGVWIVSMPADEDHRFAYALELAKKLGLVVSGDTVALAHGHMSGISSLTSFRMVVLA